MKKLISIIFAPVLLVGIIAGVTGVELLLGYVADILNLPLSEVKCWNEYMITGTIYLLSLFVFIPLLYACYSAIYEIVNKNNLTK